MELLRLEKKKGNKPFIVWLFREEKAEPRAEPRAEKAPPTADKKDTPAAFRLKLAACILSSALAPTTIALH